MSDAWLENHSGGDKAFTMGGFAPRYVEQFPCALVRIEGAHRRLRHHLADHRPVDLLDGPDALFRRRARPT